VVAPSIGRGEDALAQTSLSDRLSRSIAHHLEPGIEWVVRLIVHHWLLIVNTMLFVFIVLPYLAPILDAAGLRLLAKIIFLAYRPTCHQLPERSFWIAGHQVAVCARCSSIYVSFWVVGMIYALWATIRPNRFPAWNPPPLWVIGAAAIPMGLDGVSQFFGFRVSTNSLRTLTGGLVGAATATVIYPYMQSGFRQAREVWEERLLDPTCADQRLD
jgi:uncharacterized membrane protein